LSSDGRIDALDERKAVMNIQELCHTGSPTQQQMAAAFDALDPVGVDMLVGLWEADPGYAETPGGRLLVESGWWGARFTDAETVDPLLFRSDDGDGLFAADLLRVLALIREGAQNISARRTEVETSAPIGRVRMIEYRGVVTATLVYDQVPVLDYLRAVDNNTVIAAVEGRAMVDRPAYALLRRRPDPPAYAGLVSGERFEHE
jgi:hypothetical protein